jgi:hypothetical protein
MVCMDSAATIVSDVACVVGLLGGSEGASGVVDGCGVAPVGACSFTWAVDGGFSSVCAGSAAVVDDDDVALATSGSGSERRGWGAVAQPGRECRCLRDVGGSSEAGAKVVVVVVDDVDNVDGGCAGVDGGDVADSGGDGGLGAVLSRVGGKGVGADRCWRCWGWQCIPTNVSARSRATPFAGLWTVSACCLRRG